MAQKQFLRCRDH